GGGSITFRFNDNALIDGPGADLYVWEVAQGEERDALDVEISEDGKQWLAAGEVDYQHPRLDIANVAKPDQIFHYVRLSDKSNLTKGEQFPGSDIDAVAAISSAPKVVLEDSTLFDPESDKLTDNATKELSSAGAVMRSVNTKN